MISKILPLVPALVLTTLSIIVPFLSCGQSTKDVYVDKSGVMRWGKSKEEVHGFGINYTGMFAHAYRTAQRLNIPLEQAIDNDIYHFARLGFDLFRVHVWDTEISDTSGNLLSNDHLRLFDYTVAKMKERGINFIITPIAFWGNGWPGPDDQTPGFSAKYGKDACLTNASAIKAQHRYLAQFLNHVNQYTGVAYKSDPAVIGFEISNEPHHRESAEKVTAFINGMAKGMRGTGCKKPIFYNVSHSIHLSDAYATAAVQGGTFQWYPTGLGSRHELGGNLLPNVNQYSIPFAGSRSWKRMAKIVYEFDAADVGRSYIYPAMARSFREAGIQVATHFAYDPTFMADVNTEYGTHYMNLAYAPQKALSLKIASAVFHKVPMNKNYGPYPANTSFENFRVNYEEDLAEMVSLVEFFYTNNTATVPPAPEKLESIAGSGNSSVVAYEGTGAYFLDRLEPGVWRLEVMPDAVWISDPFAPTSPKKKVAVIHWRSWPMTITLPDLGSNFKATGFQSGSTISVAGASFPVSPGTYLLTKDGVSSLLTGNDRWKNIILSEFSAPASTVKETHVIHTPAVEVTEGTVTVATTVISQTLSDTVELFVVGQGRREETVPMKRVRNYQYKAELTAKAGFLKYYIVVRNGNEKRTFPSNNTGEPGDWDFYDRNPYEVRVVPATSPLYLFDASTDAEEVSRQWIRTAGVVPTSVPGKSELVINVEKLFVPDPENQNGTAVADYSLRYHFGKKISGRRNDLSSKRSIVIDARSLNGKSCPIQLSLIMNDGSIYGALIALDPGQKECTLLLADLKATKLVTLPRPYPTFLPYYFDRAGEAGFDLNRIESLQLSIGHGLSKESQAQQNGIVIRTIRLE